MNNKLRNFSKTIPATSLVGAVAGLFIFVMIYADSLIYKKSFNLDQVLIVSLAGSILVALLIIVRTWLYSKDRNDKFVFLPYYEESINFDLSTAKRLLQESSQSGIYKLSEQESVYRIDHTFKFYSMKDKSVPFPLILELVRVDDEVTLLKARYDKKLKWNLDQPQAPYYTIKAIIGGLTNSQKWT